MKSISFKTCPYCGELLEEGELRNRGSNYYLPKDAGLPLWYSKRTMDKKGAIMLPPNPYSISFPPVFPKAWVCRSCKIILIPYEYPEEDFPERKDDMQN
ncbi:MAG: hypothetical protein IK082_04770 [Oscillospiraceae bacterium]|nr:hypothetical protein [Oscillospiraceae bacterium]